MSIITELVSEFIMQTLVEIVFYGSAEVTKNKKCPLILRVAAALLLIALFVGLFGLIAVAGILMVRDSMITAGIIMFIIDAILIICAIRKIVINLKKVKPLVDEKEDENEVKVVSYEKYYRTMAISALIGGILWIGCAFIDKFPPVSKERMFISVINVVLSVVMFLMIVFITLKMLIFTAMRDKEDELYKENKAKTDKLFITILYYMAMPIIALGVFVSGFEFTFNYYIATGIIWLMLSLYHFIALHYEKIGTNSTDDELDQ